jgi:hypothetical protein
MTPATSTPFSDAAALAKLATAGNDLTQLHRIEFALHFPTRFKADEASLKLEALAFDTKVSADSKTGRWLVLGVKRMYPVEADLQGLRDKLDVIAAEGKGSYDGWTARAAK